MIKKTGYKEMHTAFVSFLQNNGKYYLITVCLLVFIFLPNILAAPVTGEIFELKQPDGTSVTVRIWGDEFYQIVESLDGFTLIRDPYDHFICYAKLSEDKTELISTGVLPGESIEELDIVPHIRISKESKKKAVDTARSNFEASQIQTLDLAVSEAFSAKVTTGNVRTVCLIVDFPDELGTIPPSDVNDFCNKIGYTGSGNNGSVRDYYYDISDGHLIYTNYVQESYYTAIHEKSYYDNPSEGFGPKARELILEALNDLESKGFDFSQYDSDGDGYIDGINCLYVGSVTSGWGKGLWPHSGVISFSADGVSTYRYMIDYMSNSLSLGIFCHESGHLLFSWPDLYDTDYESRGIGKYCLMAYGGSSKNPVEPCAYLKYINGWTNTTILTTPVPQDGLILTAGVNSIYKFENPVKPDEEYFLIENRQKTNRDSTLTDSGLALWLIDTQGSNNNQQMTPYSHYKVTLVQADGNWDLEHKINLGDVNDLWEGPAYETCGPYTTPNTNWWNGMLSNFGIRNVSVSGQIMTFTYGLDPMEITPDEPFNPIGPYGGPFEPDAKVYTIINNGTEAIDYYVSKSETWFSLNDGNGQTDNPLSGTLDSNESIEIELVLNDNADTLEEGYYTDTIIFSNLTTGIEIPRIITFSVVDPVIIYENDFSDLGPDDLPEGWTIVDGYNDGETWTSADVNDYSSIYDDYLDGMFMIVDSYNAGDGISMDEQLITHSMDFSYYESITLKFDHFFIHLNDTAQVSMILLGRDWPLATFTEYSAGPVELQLSPMADGYNDVKIKWRYTSNFDFNWSIDNVKITGSCAFKGDLNNDCSVNINDLEILAAHWLDKSCNSANNWCLGADMNRSTFVSIDDLADLSEHWGQGHTP